MFAVSSIPLRIYISSNTALISVANLWTSASHILMGWQATGKRPSWALGGRSRAHDSAFSSGFQGHHRLLPGARPGEDRQEIFHRHPDSPLRMFWYPPGLSISGCWVPFKTFSHLKPTQFYWPTVCMLFHKYYVTFQAGWCGSVVWVLACKLKAYWFDSQAGHMRGWQVRSPVGGTWEAIDPCFSCTSFRVSLPLFLPRFSSLWK